MLALATTALLFLYVLVPVAVFRLVFASFVRLKKSPRTRGEQITFALLIAVVPFQVARGLAFGHAPLAPLQMAEATRASLAVLADAVLAGDPPQDARPAFWAAAGAVAGQQRRFLAFFYPLVAGEALLFGLLGRHYGSILAALEPGRGRFRRLRRLARNVVDYAGARLLFPSISEWDALFTPSLFLPRRERATAHVDVLTSDDHLYRGRVVEYFLDESGKLSGIYLTGAQRFRRAEYQASRAERGPGEATERFWRPIPGHQLYLDADKIGTINVRFVPDPALAISRGLASGKVAVEVVANPAGAA